MEQKFISLEEYTRNAVRRRDSAQARLDALGDEATFSNTVAVRCAQSQVTYLESLDDEPIPFMQKDEAGVAPHLLAQLEKQKSNANGNHSSAPKIVAAK